MQTQMQTGTAARPFHMSATMALPRAWTAGQPALGTSTAERGGPWLRVCQSLRALNEGLAERAEQAWAVALDRLAPHGDYVGAGAYSRAEAAEDGVGSVDPRVLLTDNNEDEDGACMHGGAALRRTRCRLSLMDAAVPLKQEGPGDEESSRHKTPDLSRAAAARARRRRDPQAPLGARRLGPRHGMRRRGGDARVPQRAVRGAGCRGAAASRLARRPAWAA